MDECRCASQREPFDKTCELAIRYLNGDGVAKDEKRAIKLLEQLAAHGHADAQCSVGICLVNGQGVAKDMGRAAALFKQATDQGHADAQFSLGCCYERGIASPFNVDRCALSSLFL